MADNDNQVTNTVSFLLADPVGRIGAFILGIVLSIVCYQNFIMVEKQAEINNKDELIRVKEERLKQKNDVIEGLKIELSYKPLKEKRILDQLAMQNNDLKLRNLALETIAKSVDIEKSVTNNYEELINQVNSLKSNNEQLSIDLLSYQNEIIIDNYSLNSGEAWNGFGGAISFGVKSVRLDNYSDITFSVQGTSTIIRVWAGTQIPFTLTGRDYILSVGKVSYVGGRVEITVSKK